MALTAFPTITYNSGTGSDTAASGAGPATALSGTACAVTSASTTVTITDAVSLGGVATDGSAVLYVVTSSGRRFTRISTVSGSSGSWTLVVQDSVWSTGTGLTWAIGGKRSTLDHAGSRLLFSADAKGGWTIVTETDQSLATELACTAVGDDTNGMIIFKGDSASTRRVLTSSVNNVSMLGAGLGHWRLENFKFTSTATTKTSSYGISCDSAPGAGNTWVARNCEFGDSSDKIQSATQRVSTASAGMVLVDCEVHHTLGIGVGDFAGTTANGCYLFGCYVHDCGAAGISFAFQGQGAGNIISNCVIASNAGNGIDLPSSGQMVFVVGSTIHNNTGHGIALGQTAVRGMIVANNNITKNGGYGISFAAGTAVDAVTGLLDFNNYGSSGSSTSNTSGTVSLGTVGVNALAVDPQYTNAGSGDYSLSGTNLKALGFPSIARHVGGNPTAGTTSYVDIGAAQRQESGSSGSRSRVGFTS